MVQTTEARGHKVSLLFIFMNSAITSDPEPLAQRWEALKQANPRLRIRDAATQLQTSEAQLLATQCGTDTLRLKAEWETLLPRFAELGTVMCLTRNEAAVHERSGEFVEFQFGHGICTVLGPDIDLRLFLRSWKSGFAVYYPEGGAVRRSFQFFDHQGNAILKVYQKSDENKDAFENLVNAFRSDNQERAESVSPAAPSHPPLPDAEIDQQGFQEAWKNMQDTHDYFMILRRFRLGREQAARLAPEGFTHKICTSAAEPLLRMASASKLPIMVFVGNEGGIQIHTGPVSRIETIELAGKEWLNVLDVNFNLHLQTELVKSVWVVRKPTRDGIVTSIELYDANGAEVVLFFGKRKPGQPEDENWRALVKELEKAS